jgi:hypothetical protein
LQQQCSITTLQHQHFSTEAENHCSGIAAALQEFAAVLEMHRSSIAAASPHKSSSIASAL